LNALSAEIKDRLKVTYNAQLQIQVSAAVSMARPLHLVVSPRTTHVSAGLIEHIRLTGGDVHVFDAATGALRRYEP